MNETQTARWQPEVEKELALSESFHTDRTTTLQHHPHWHNQWQVGQHFAKRNHIKVDHQAPEKRNTPLAPLLSQPELSQHSDKFHAVFRTQNGGRMHGRSIDEGGRVAQTGRRSIHRFRSMVAKPSTPAAQNAEHRCPAPPRWHAQDD